MFEGAAYWFWGLKRKFNRWLFKKLFPPEAVEELKTLEPTYRFPKIARHWCLLLEAPSMEELQMKVNYFVEMGYTPIDIHAEHTEFFATHKATMLWHSLEEWHPLRVKVFKKFQRRLKKAKERGFNGGR